MATRTAEIVEVDWTDPLHRDGVVQILDSYSADPCGNGKPLAADVQARLVPALSAHPTSLVVLALVEGQPVGVAVCFVGLSTFQARPLLNLHDLAVLPQYRGQGIGRMLLEAVETKARSRGCCKLTLEVQAGNERARRIYAAFGFSDFTLGNSMATHFLSKPL